MRIWAPLTLTDKSRKLDNYFVQQICHDGQLQAHNGNPLQDGPLFVTACEQMKELGYNPYEIQQIIFKGYTKTLGKKMKRMEDAEKWQALQEKR